MRLWCWWSFNSLSRDHRPRQRGVRREHERVPFNSLSRDRLKATLFLAGRSRHDEAFNSLSRDHAFGDNFVQRQEAMELSTPSLGITLRGLFSTQPMRRPQHSFNSLSRDHTPRGSRTGRSGSGSFQLPLSGSRKLHDVSELPEARFQLPLSGSQGQNPCD